MNIIRNYFDFEYGHCLQVLKLQLLIHTCHPLKLSKFNQMDIVEVNRNLNTITNMEFEAEGINLTEDKIASIDSLYPYMLCMKVLLLLWDTLGLIVNGLGIDLMWHGIEINHAVYSLVLQDIVLCWLSSFLWCMLNWIWWSTSGMF